MSQLLHGMALMPHICYASKQRHGWFHLWYTPQKEYVFMETKIFSYFKLNVANLKKRWMKLSKDPLFLAFYTIQRNTLRMKIIWHLLYAAHAVQEVFYQNLPSIWTKLAKPNCIFILQHINILTLKNRLQKITVVKLKACPSQNSLCLNNCLHIYMQPTMFAPSLLRKTLKSPFQPLNI